MADCSKEGGAAALGRLPALWSWPPISLRVCRYDRANEDEIPRPLSSITRTTVGIARSTCCGEVSGPFRSKRIRQTVRLDHIHLLLT